MLRIWAAVAALLMIVASVIPTYAAPYKTYTYDINGRPQLSSDAYTPIMQIDSAYMGLPSAMSDPRDLFVGPDGRIYIVEGGNNRVDVLDPNFKFLFAISSFVNDQGVPDSLNGPSGCFVTDEYIYVADTENNRIVVFTLDGEIDHILEAPTSAVFEQNNIYKPVALAVDSAKRIYVVSSTTYQGIIALNEKGEFQGFIGAQRVTYNIIDIIWRSFQTAEQRALSTQYISTEYNNITIDEEGFIYVTTSSIDEGAQRASIRDKASPYAPVKKLNTAGSDVMSRNGFFSPHGEVNINDSPIFSDITGPSKIIDVALGEEGTWSIIDEKRSRIYTYDQDGNLLFAFGDKGMQVGNIQSIEAIAYKGSDLLVLDKTANNITLYSRTEYGDILINALRNENQRRYERAIDDYKAILQRNSNFDTAYVGIGKALYRQGKWTEAMEYFKAAYDVPNFSNAFKMYRQEWVSKYFIVIPIVVVLVCWGLMKFFSFAAKVNKKTAISTKKRTFGQEILYGFHLIFHPFDGFWDLKHEKRGSIRGAIFYIALSVLAFTYQAIGRSYIFNPRATYASILVQVTSLLVPLFLWVTANWCLTTLMDGQGSFKDIFVATSYSLLPLPMFIIPATLLTNVLLDSERGIYTMLITIAWYWVGILIFFGMMVTHDYTLGKNIITSIGTIVGMAFIMFVMILLSTLVVKMVGFVSSIVTEISYRL
ncbi:MAG TPA: YIP1 family protein [Bacillota bacterium]|nr:YIP1 family protein [Bacillota bacterium]